MRCRLSVLGVPVELSGPEPLIRQIEHAYGRFAATSDGNGVSVHVSIDAPPTRIEVDGESRSIVAGLDPLFQLHQQFQRSVLERVDGLAVLHAASLLGPRGVLLLAGPAGHGKSSLTLALVERGMRFLSDDYAPLDLERRLVHPFPRRVAISQTPHGPLPDGFADAVRDGSAPRWFDKVLLDVGEVQGEGAMADEPAPLRHVVLLHGGAGVAPPERTRFEVVVRRAEAEALAEQLARVDGVTVREYRTEAGPRRFEVVQDHRRHSSRALEPLLEDDAVVFHRKFWDGAPGFSERPLLESIGPREAAASLGRELLNRGGRSALTRRFAGGEAGLFVELAGALADADCRTLVPGPLDETADAIERLVAAESAP